MATPLAENPGLILCRALAMAAATAFPRRNDTPPTGARFPGKFVWADLFRPDPATEPPLYTGLPGWKATTIERATASGTHPYIGMANGGEPVAGIARRPARMLEAKHGRRAEFSNPQPSIS